MARGHMAPYPCRLPRGYPGYSMATESSIVPDVFLTCTIEPVYRLDDSRTMLLATRKHQNLIPGPFGDGRHNSEDAP